MDDDGISVRERASISVREKFAISPDGEYFADMPNVAEMVDSEPSLRVTVSRIDTPDDASLWWSVPVNRDNFNNTYNQLWFTNTGELAVRYASSEEGQPDNIVWLAWHDIQQQRLEETFKLTLPDNACWHNVQVLGRAVLAECLEAVFYFDPELNTWLSLPTNNAVNTMFCGENICANFSIPVNGYEFAQYNFQYARFVSTEISNAPMFYVGETLAHFGLGQDIDQLYAFSNDQPIAQNVLGYQAASSGVIFWSQFDSTLWISKEGNQVQIPFIHDARGIHLIVEN